MFLRRILVVLLLVICLQKAVRSQGKNIKAFKHGNSRWFDDGIISEYDAKGAGGDQDEEDDTEKLVQNLINRLKNRKNVKGKKSDMYNSETTIVETTVVTVTPQPREIDPCGSEQPLVLTAPSGVVKSPGFERNEYSDNSECKWTFSAPAGHVVKLKFKTMDIEASDDCVLDSVEVRDEEDSWFDTIGKYCGKDIPTEIIQSTSQELKVFFNTDTSVHLGKFSFQWEFIDVDNLQTTTLPSQTQGPSDLSCGLPAIQPNLGVRITNGEEAVPHSWPWQVIIETPNGEKTSLCGGSIISPTAVLTAAHCFYDTETGEYLGNGIVKIETGDYDVFMTEDGPTQRPLIKDIIVHHQYEGDETNDLHDIAIILLSSPLEFNDNVKAVCLPTDDARPDDLCYATGWRVDNLNDMFGKYTLNQVKLPIISNEVCTQEDYWGSYVTETKMCAGYEEGGKSTCSGDSGGPLVCQNRLNGRWYLQGITSFGPKSGCGVPKRPSVFTRVMAYLSWILELTKVKQ